MSNWPSVKARIALRALEKIGWHPVSQSGSHRKLVHQNHQEHYIWAFGDSDEIGPKMLARIAKRTGLKPEDL